MCVKLLLGNDKCQRKLFEVENNCEYIDLFNRFAVV